MRNFIISVALLAPLALAAKAPKCVVEGRIGRWNDSTKVAFSYFYKGATVRVGEAYLKNGKFRFEADIDEPASASLTIFYKGEKFLRDSRNVFSFYIDTEPIRIDSPDSLHHAVAKGKINDLARDYYKQIAPSLEDIQIMMNDARLAVPREQRRDPAFLASLNEKENQLRQQLKQRQVEYVKTHPDSYFSVLALFGVFSVKLDYKEAGPLFNSIAPQLQNTFEGQRFSQRLRVSEEISKGNMAPEFALKDANGNEVKLSDFRGKYLLLDFMGSWCTSCRRELPHVIAAYEKFKNRDLQALTVFIESVKQPDKWLKTIETDRIPWTCVVDWQPEQPVTILYGITGVPRLLLISPEGRILNHDVKAAVLEQVLNETLPAAK